jgi:Zn-dependent protease
MLGWSINMFRIRGIQISLHWLFFALLAYVCYDGYQDAGIAGLYWSAVTLLAFFACIVLHELGHSFTGMWFGFSVRRILLTPIGGIAEFDRIPKKPYQELLVTIAGPSVNFAIAAILWSVVRFPNDADSTQSLNSLGDLGRILLVWNIRVGLFNLIPAFPMDGGRILRALLARKFDFVRATDLAVYVARVVSVGFVIVGLMGTYQLLVLAPFLWIMGTREQLLARTMADQHIGYGRGVDVLPRDAWNHRSTAAGRRFTIRQRDGRFVIEAIE